MGLIIALPLLGAAALLLGGARLDRWGHWFAVAMSAGAFALALVAFRRLALDPARHADHVRVFAWLSAGGLRVDVSLLFDQLSVAFALLVTGVGTVIHVYSVGYLRHDPHRRRFFAYLNLFLAAMLLLVLADDYLVLYVGWEGVGLASYLLIGFWQHRPSAAAAARKAFVVNRVGDAGLAIGVMLAFATFGTVSFAGVFARAPAAGRGTLTALGLLFLLGACAKSAQLPLQSWLLDAMEGPTPVSALIHAATMVTAGVYLIARSHAIFDLAPAARAAVLVVGAATLLFGAVIGCAKDDIKKALAASTMSQLGYMILATGLGPAGYGFAIMHLLTHGFFKAGLFLGAGSVMHAMDDEVDMRRYGGLRQVLPVTFATFGLSYLALIGVPPFAGFYSKDGIIAAAVGLGGAAGPALGAVAIAGAGLTAFYLTRVVILTFFGPRRWAPNAAPRESPAVMTGPLILLALGSASAGLLLARGDALVRWLAPVVGEARSASPVPGWALTAAILAVVAVGVAVAVVRVGRAPVPATAPAAVSALTRAARADLYGDAVNEAVFERGGRSLVRGLVVLERRVLDGALGAIGAAVARAGAGLRRVQTGYVRSYALSMFGGLVAIAAVLVLIGR